MPDDPARLTALVARPSRPVMDLGDALGDTDGPLYRRLAQALRRAIETGVYPPKSRLPAERTLASQLGVSRVTVVAAYEVLADDGFIERRRGSGTMVAAQPPGADPWAVASIRDVLSAHGSIPGEMLGSGTDRQVQFGIAALPGLELLVERVRETAAELPQLIEGYGYVPQGHLPLREAIAERYSANGLPTSPEQLVITNGAQQALNLLATLLVGPGGVALVEDPTYPGILDSLRAIGATIVSVPVDASGVRPDLLAAQVARWRPRLVYLVATHHNPTGVVLSPARRQELLELLGKRRIPILDDLSLSGLALDDTPEPPSLAVSDPRGMVITVGSLSKLVWGGLRVGWIRAPLAVVDQLVRLKLAHDHGGSLVSQALTTPLVAQLDAIAEARRAMIRERYAALTEAMRAHLPDWAWTRPSGGLSMWVRMPHGQAETLAELALRRGVTIVPGPAFSATGGHADRVRLPFGAAPATIATGIERLAEAWDEYRPIALRQGGRMRVVV